MTTETAIILLLVFIAFRLPTIRDSIEDLNDKLPPPGTSGKER